MEFWSVRELRRYPVKSMGGESLESVAVDERGLDGDRWFAVVDDQGRLASGKDTTRFRRRDAVFDYAATTRGHDTVVQQGERTWVVGDPMLDAELTTTMSSPVRVLPEAAMQHHDAGQVSLVGSATLDWCTEHLEVDADPRRVRPNIVVETTTPFVEESWVGGVVSIGGARLRVVKRIERCRMVDLAQDGLETTTPLLKALGRERDVCLGVYADVVTPAPIAVGDPVSVLHSHP